MACAHAEGHETHRACRAPLIVVIYTNGMMLWTMPPGRMGVTLEACLRAAPVVRRAKRAVRVPGG